MNKSTSNQLRQFFQNNLTTVLEKAIIPVGNNTFQVFNIYTIAKHSRRRVEVFKRGQRVTEFSNTKCALAWVISDKNHRYVDSSTIVALDSKKRRLRDDISFSLMQLKYNKDYASQYTRLLKTQHKQQILESVENQLNKYTSNAKYV